MNKYHKILGALFIAFLTIQMFVGVAVADSDSDDLLGSEKDDDDDGVDDDKEEWNERIVEVEVDDDEIEIKSILKNGNRRDKFELEVNFEDDDGLEIEFDYESEIDSDGKDEEYELEFEVDFHEIIEYVDKDGNGLYNPEKDETIQKYEISNFQTPDYSKKEKDDGSTVHKITISTNDNVFTAVIYVVEEFIEIHDQIISPTEAKIDIIINNFNYLNNTSQLALYIKLESEEEYEEVEDDDDDDDEIDDDEIDDDEESVKTEDGDYTGFFSWADTAIIDGVAKPVLSNSKTTDHEDDDEEKIYFNYPRGTLIIHDPKIGISGVILETSPLFSFDNILFVAILAGILATIGVSTFLIIKKRKKSKRSQLIPEEELIN